MNAQRAFILGAFIIFFLLPGKFISNFHNLLLYFSPDHNRSLFTHFVENSPNGQDAWTGAAEHNEATEGAN
jgi:hypothetical protein